jgi:hypothetical protein
MNAAMLRRLEAVERELERRAGGVDPLRTAALVQDLAPRIRAQLGDIAAGHPPRNAIQRAVIEHEGDVAAALRALLS